MPKKSLNKLKEEFIGKIKNYLDSGTCSIGHGVYIYKNGKKVAFINCTNYTQSPDPIENVREEMEDEFKENGYETKLEYGRMD